MNSAIFSCKPNSPSVLLLSTTELPGVMHVGRCYQPFAMRAMNIQRHSSSMQTQTNVSWKLRMFVTLLPSVSTEMERRWMSFMVQDLSDFVIVFGCIRDRACSNML